MTASAPDGATPPLLRVVRGTPDDQALAALVAVVAARARATAKPSTRPASVWAAKSRLVRPPLRPSSGAWRASAWPR